MNEAVSLLPSLLCPAHGEEEEQSCQVAATGTSPFWGS